MKDFNENYHIPARITEFQETENTYLTKAKLEVFYIGETVDKRLFTQEFSENLIKTIPQMPIVAYYDEDNDDFIGHNAEQYVYGYVPEITELEFRERDDRTYAVTDVILFTGRNDNIGEVAKKIVGKSQSLEMDPASVTYKVNKENGQFKNIEFTSGSIVGMSVLGDDENPAFSGSHFFKEKLGQHPEYAETFMKFINEARQLLDGETGGVSMNKFLEDLLLNFDVEAFIKKTYDEERAEVHSALAESRGNQWFHIVQMNSDTVVVYDYETGEFSRANYSRSEEDSIEFSENEKVIARYLTEDEIDSTFSTDVEDETETETEETEFTETETEEETEEVTETEEKEAEVFTETETETQEEEVVTEEETEEVEFNETVSDEQEEETTDAEEATEETQEETFTESDDTSTSETLISEERAELEEFRTKQKLDVLNKYESYLTEEQTKELLEKLPTCNAAKFEKEIKVVAFDAMQEALTNNTNTQEEPVTRFTIGNIDGEATEAEKLYATMKNLL